MSNYEIYSELAKVNKDAVSERFDSFNGVWKNYAIFERVGGQVGDKLLNQKHIDLRNFDPEIAYNYSNVFDLSKKVLSNLDNKTVADLQALSQTGGENWQSSTNSTFSISQIQDAFFGIQITCDGPVSPATSKNHYVESVYETIDISTLETGSKIIIALPNFAGDKINRSNSYVDFSSSSQFDIENTDSINFSALAATAGNSQNLIIPIEALTKLDLNNLIAVRFRINVTASCIFKCLSIKIVSPDWKYPALDFDTINNRLCKPVSNFSPTVFEPLVELGELDDIGGNLPTDWPVLQRAFDNAFTSQDPKVSTGTFNTFMDIGNPITSKASELNPNIFSIYYNLKSKTSNQLELDSKTQAELSSAGINPSAYGRDSLPSKQADFSVIPSTEIAAGRPENQTNSINASNSLGLTGSQLQTRTQQTLNYLPDNTRADFLAFSINWYLPETKSALIKYEFYKTETEVLSLNGIYTNIPTSGVVLVNQEQVQYLSVEYDYENNVTLLKQLIRGINNSVKNTNFVPVNTVIYFDFSAKVKILNSDDTIYSFELPNSISLMNSKIIFSTSLEDDAIYFKLYKINKYNQIQLIYTSDKIINHLYFRPVKNRLGWYAKLIDGDTYINSIRSGGLVYAEYKAHTMKSRTPLKGLNLFADYSNDIDLLQPLTFNQAGNVTQSSRILNVDSSAGLAEGDLIGGPGILANTKIAGILSNTQILLDKEATVESSKSLIVEKQLKAYNGSIVSDDYDKSKDLTSLKVSIDQGLRLSGLITESFVIEDKTDVDITFDFWYPNNKDKINFILFDKNETPLMNLESSFYKQGQWESVKIYLSQNEFICGTYKFGIIQTSASKNTNWWVNNLSIKRKIVSWEARSSLSRLPGYASNNWIQMKNNTNAFSGGAMFEEKGKELQFRAKAKTHYALIHDIKVLPNYATLGNFVWRDE